MTESAREPTLTVRALQPVAAALEALGLDGRALLAEAGRAPRSAGLLPERQSIAAAASSATTASGAPSLPLIPSAQRSSRESGRLAASGGAPGIPFRGAGRQPCECPAGEIRRKERVVSSLEGCEGAARAGPRHTGGVARLRSNGEEPRQETATLADSYSLPQLWGRRGFWRIRLRWAVAPLMIAGVYVARALDVELASGAILAIAIASPLYNGIFAWIFSRYEESLAADPSLDRLLVVVEVVADYILMLLLLHFTGGATSPLVFFLLFHVLIGAVQFTTGTAYLFAALASAGLIGMHLGQLLGWWSAHGIAFRGQPLDLLDRPALATVLLLSFATTLFVAATMVSRIMDRLRHRVDDLGRASAKIEALMRDRTQFMLQVAHNLRAPLGAGLGMLELVRTGRLGEVTAQQSSLLERLDDRLRALDRAIGQLLTIAKTRDFSREIPDVVVDLEELAAQVEQTFRAEALARQLSLAIDVEPGLPMVESGVDLLKEVMENLVSNAIRYTPAGGEVTVRFERAGPDEVRILVRDTGIGIPEAEQGKLFQEFFRATNAKRHSPAGTGLGLTLVQRTVSRHHGRVRIDSAEGKGTLVEIEIPVRRVGAPAESAPAELVS